MASNIRNEIAFSNTARTADPTPFVFENNSGDTITAVVSFNAIPAALSSVTIRIEAYEPANNSWYTAGNLGATTLTLDSTAGGSGTVINLYHAARYFLIKPGRTTASNLSANSSYTVTSGVIGPLMRLRITHSNSESWTYNASIYIS